MMHFDIFQISIGHLGALAQSVAAWKDYKRGRPLAVKKTKVSQRNVYWPRKRSRQDLAIDALVQLKRVLDGFQSG